MMTCWRVPTLRLRRRVEIFCCACMKRCQRSSFTSSGTAAANDLAAAVPDDVKEDRWHRFMQAQQKISTRRLKRKVGTRQQVIIDSAGPTISKGRSMADAPEIDGAVYVASRRPLRVGEIATVKIERADEYDLHGAVVGY